MRAHAAICWPGGPSMFGGRAGAAQRGGAGCRRGAGALVRVCGVVPAGQGRRGGARPVHLDRRQPGGWRQRLAGGQPHAELRGGRGGEGRGRKRLAWRNPAAMGKFDRRRAGREGVSGGSRPSAACRRRPLTAPRHQRSLRAPAGLETVTWWVLVFAEVSHSRGGCTGLLLVSRHLGTIAWTARACRRAAGLVGLAAFGLHNAPAQSLGGCTARCCCARVRRSGEPAGRGWQQGLPARRACRE